MGWRALIDSGLVSPHSLTNDSTSKAPAQNPEMSAESPRPTLTVPRPGAGKVLSQGHEDHQARSWHQKWSSWLGQATSEQPSVPLGACCGVSAACCSSLPRVLLASGASFPKEWLSFWLCAKPPPTPPQFHLPALPPPPGPPPTSSPEPPAPSLKPPGSTVSLAFPLLQDNSRDN